jgi:hypothetical protein
METVEDVLPETVEEVKQEEQQAGECGEVKPEEHNVLIHDYKNNVTYLLLTKSKEASTALMGHSLVVNFAQSACEHHKFNSIKRLYELDNEEDEYYKALKRLNITLDESFLTINICNIKEFVKHCMKYIYRLNKDKYQNEDDKENNISEKDFIENSLNAFI